MGLRLVLVVAMLGACNAKLGGAVDAGKTQDGPAAHDGATNPDAIALGAWGTPTPVNGASDSAISQDDCTLSSSQTELYFGVPDPGITGTPKQLWSMTRAASTDPWGPPARMSAAFNTAVQQESPRLSPDDLTIYFGRSGDIYSATRTSVAGPWSTPAMVASVSTASYEKWLAVCNGGTFMVSRANSPNGQDLYQGQLGAAGTLVTELSSTSNETGSFLSADCLTTYFASGRSGSTQIYTATRTSIASPWTTPTMMTDFGMSADNEDPWISPDLRTFVFATVRAPDLNKAVYVSTR